MWGTLNLPTANSIAPLTISYPVDNRTKSEEIKSPPIRAPISIINNSPFVNSNILLKNNKSVASLDSLLDKELSRFFEKNKNDYKGKTIKELLERIPEDIFQEIDSDLNDKLYELDPSKINIGQIHKEDKMYIRNITNLDGNAFLRAFLFNYLEQIISRKDINKFISSYEMTEKLMKKMQNNKGGMKNMLKGIDPKTLKGMKF